MTITGAIVLYAVIWFMGMLVALPLGLQTHGDDGTDDDRLTPASSPQNPNLRRKAVGVTVITTIFWSVLCLIILSGWITIEDLDFFDRM